MNAWASSVWCAPPACSARARSALPRPAQRNYMPSSTYRRTLQHHTQPRASPGTCGNFPCTCVRHRQCDKILKRIIQLGGYDVESGIGPWDPLRLASVTGDAMDIGARCASIPGSPPSPTLTPCARHPLQAALVPPGRDQARPRFHGRICWLGRLAERRLLARD